MFYQLVLSEGQIFMRFSGVLRLNESRWSETNQCSGFNDTAVAWPLAMYYQTNAILDAAMKDDQLAELKRLHIVLDIAKRNGNQLFIDNIEREIAAVERGESSPLIEEYLTEEERASDQLP